MNRKLKAVVIGGGIGGLTAGIALRQAGIEAAVYERAHELKEIGAGIGLAPNAMKALAHVGLAERVAGQGETLVGGAIRTWKGAVLGSGEDAQAILSVCVHRSDLQRVLAEELGAGAVQLGCEVVGVEAGKESAVARFANGREAEGDVVVGADGLHSVVRASIHGEENPRYAGYTAWRAVTTYDIGRLAGETWGPGRRFGFVPLGAGRAYWFATKNAPEGEKDPPGGPKQEIARLFAGWHSPIEELIEATASEAIVRHDIYDRKPLKESWGKGTVTLLGDAAHPMTPNLGQGACQAIEDAVILGEFLRGATDITAVLRRYEGARIPKTAYVTNLSRRFGQIGQATNPVLSWLRDQVVRTVPPSIQKRQFEKIAQFELPDGGWSPSGRMR